MRSEDGSVEIVMKTRACAHGRWLRRHRVGLKMGLLLLPVLFWSVVFAALAGVRTLERAIERAPDPAQILIAATFPLLAVIIGLDVIKRDGRPAKRDSEKGGMKFSNSGNARSPVLLINESDLPTRFIIGHENSPLHKKTESRL